MPHIPPPPRARPAAQSPRPRRRPSRRQRSPLPDSCRRFAFAPYVYVQRDDPVGFPLTVTGVPPRFGGQVDLPPVFWGPVSGVRRRCGCGSSGPRIRLGLSCPRNRGGPPERHQRQARQRPARWVEIPPGRSFLSGAGPTSDRGLWSLSVLAGQEKGRLAAPSSHRSDLKLRRRDALATCPIHPVQILCRRWDALPCAGRG